MPVVVVDNASSDDTCAKVRGRAGVILIQNKANRGFAAAVNQGVAALDTTLVLLLNPDTRLGSALDALEETCTAGGAGLASGLLRGTDGRAQAGFALRRFPTPITLSLEVLGLNRLAPWNPWNRRYRCLDVDLSRTGACEQPPGAFLMFRRDVWQRLGGFDTQFEPVWFEDVDFCKRARDLGFKIQYVPEVVATHQGGHSVATMDWPSRELCWYVSLLKYAYKHFRPYSCRGVSAAVVIGSLFRATIGLIRLRSVRPIKVYAKVAGIAMRGFFMGRVDHLNCCVV
jgi:GT2 family glycosyltransferase